MENEKKKKFTIQKMCMTAVFMALTCMATAFIQIPIPLGYAHLGDCIILIAAYLCGPVAGALAGGDRLSNGGCYYGLCHLGITYLAY